MTISEKPDDIAPDGSEIRLLCSTQKGGLCHCTLPVGMTSRAVRHQTVEEIWFFIEGEGQVWQKLGDQEESVDVHPGISLTIPVGTHFQFRNTGENPLRFAIVTMLPWPGEEEAIRVKDHWTSDIGG
ncbi:MAG: cupin domain-containing protein [Candidatus Aminicenantes bacterium]|nr:MAG: cupin domain-containing protein [Candidatus Aminicenantes bacterium]